MKPPFRHGALLGALAVVLVVPTAACSSDHAAVGASSSAGTVAVPGVVPPTLAAMPPATVQPVALDQLAMVGDSITVGAFNSLVDGFATLGLVDDAVDIDAQNGRRMVQGGNISSGLSAIEDITSTADPDVWVIALGTNDVANYGSEEYAPTIGEVLEAIPADAPIVWVDTYLERYQDEAASFNDVLRQVLAERGQATVVDWSSVAAQDGVLTDGVHPSGFGAAEFTRRVIAAVDAWTT